MRRSSAGGLAVLIAVVGVLGAWPEVSAQDGSGWNPGDPGVFAGYTEVTLVETDRPGPAGGGVARICVLAEELDLDGESVLDTIVTAPVEGHGYWVVCRYPDDPASAWTVVDFVFYDPGDPTGGNLITPTMVREYALSLLDLGPPAVRFQPPAEAQVVGVETWIGHPPDGVPDQARHAAAGPLWASAYARATLLAYDMGDGSPPVVCVRPAVFKPGSPASPPPCGRHTYQRSSLDRFGGVYVVRTTATYSVSVATESQPVPQFVQVLASETAIDDVVATDLEAVIH